MRLTLPDGTKVDELEVPGDGNCFYTALLIAMLLPHVNHPALFNEHCKELLGSDLTEQEQSDLRSLLQEKYDGSEDFIKQNPMIEEYASAYLRPKLVQWMKRNKLKFQGFLTDEEFKRELDIIQTPTRWAGDITIGIVRKLFATKRIHIYTQQNDDLVEWHKYDDQKTPQDAFPVYLIYASYRGESENNHYRVLMDPNKLPVCHLKSCFAQTLNITTTTTSSKEEDKYRMVADEIEDTVDDRAELSNQDNILSLINFDDLQKFINITFNKNKSLQSELLKLINSCIKDQEENIAASLKEYNQTKSTMWLDSIYVNYQEISRNIGAAKFNNQVTGAQDQHKQIQILFNNLKNLIESRLQNIDKILFTKKGFIKNNDLAAAGLYYSQLEIVQNEEIKQALNNTLNFFLEQEKINPTQYYKKVFISYAWPIEASLDQNENKDNQSLIRNEKWIQPFLRTLRAHLRQAGIEAILDIADNQHGKSIIQFMHEHATQSDFIILIGTPSLYKKHLQGTSILCTELSKINRRRRQDRIAKRDDTVLPIILYGDPDTSLPEENERYATIRDWQKRSYVDNLKTLLTTLQDNTNHEDVWRKHFGRLYNDVMSKFAEEVIEQKLKEDQASERKKQEEKRKRDKQRLEKIAIQNGLNKNSVVKKLEKEQTVDEALQQILAHEENEVSVQQCAGIMFNISEENNYFVGRKKEISEVEEKLKQQFKVVIHGYGGIGKTQIAKNFSYKHRKNYDWICWFDASGDIEEQYQRLADEVDPDIAKKIFETDQQKKLNKITTATKNWFKRQNKNWLFIFDNVSTQWQKIKTYCPPISKDKKNHVLITSRNGMGSLPKVSILAWSPEEAENYIDKFDAIKTESSESRLGLIKELEYIPLAIAQAVAYLCSHPTVKISDYILQFKAYRKKLWEKEQQLLSSQESELEHLDNYKLTIQTTINLSLDEIKKSHAAEALLQFCSLLYPIYIPDFLIKQWFVTHNFSESFDDEVRKIWEHSLMTISSDKSRFDMHNLIQEVVLLSADKNVIAQRLREVVENLRKLFQFSPTNQSQINQCDRLVVHVEKVLTNTVLTDLLIEDVIELNHRMGIYCRVRRHDNKQALVYLDKIILKFQAQIPAKKLISLKRQLAKCYLDSCQEQEAEKIYQELKEYSEDKSIDILDRIDILCDIGSYYSKKKYIIKIDKIQDIGGWLKSPSTQQSKTVRLSVNSKDKKNYQSTLAKTFFDKAQHLITTEENKESISEKYQFILIQKEAKIAYYYAVFLYKLAGTQPDLFIPSSQYNFYKVNLLQEGLYHFKNFFDLSDVISAQDPQNENNLFKANAYFSSAAIQIALEKIRKISGQQGFKIEKQNLEKARKNLRISADLFGKYYTEDMAHSQQKKKKCYTQIINSYDLDLVDPKSQDYLNDIALLTAASNSVNKKRKQSDDATGEGKKAAFTKRRKVIKPMDSLTSNALQMFKAYQQRIADTSQKMPLQEGEIVDISSSPITSFVSESQPSESAVPTNPSHLPSFTTFEQPENSKQTNSNLYHELLKALSEWGSEQATFNRAIQLSLENNEEKNQLKEDLNKQAAQFGFQCQDVLGDGNCFFHAILDQLQRVNKLPINIKTHEDLRAFLVQHLIDNIDSYCEFFGKDKDTFISEISTSGIWADDVVISALSRALNVTLVIIKSDGSLPHIIKQLNAVTTIYLGYEVGWHYQSMVIDPTKSIQAIQTMIQNEPANLVIQTYSAKQNVGNSPYTLFGSADTSNVDKEQRKIQQNYSELVNQELKVKKLEFIASDEEFSVTSEIDDENDSNESQEFSLVSDEESEIKVNVMKNQ